jgi:hypothetical protein
VTGPTRGRYLHLPPAEYGDEELAGPYRRQVLELKDTAAAPPRKKPSRRKTLSIPKAVAIKQVARGRSG